jgi:dTDP-4-amino-4,6-dideoxygalactose transaminase
MSTVAAQTEAVPRWVVPLSDIEIDDDIVSAVEEVVRSGWWSMGPRVEEFEAAFATYCGTPNAVAVANGTAALHLALLAAGCGPGDEVILPSLTFVAAANAVVQTGATPVFCDIIGPDDLNLSPDDVADAVTPATRAIIAFHYGGHPCRMDPLLELAAERDLFVIEDAAHAPGSRLNGRLCGTLGHVGCFSLFANKNLPVGEGGVVVTADPAIAEQIRLLRSHGMTRLTWDRHRGHASSYDVVRAGFNYRLDELRAAIGLVQLDRLDDGNRRRARVVAEYRARLHGTEGLTMPFSQSSESVSHHLAVLLLPEGADRAAFRRMLEVERIQTSVHYPPIHGFTYYEGHERRPKLPRTDDLAARLVTLPLFPHVESAAIDLVTSTVLESVAKIAC